MPSAWEYIEDQGPGAQTLIGLLNTPSLDGAFIYEMDFFYMINWQGLPMPLRT